MHYLTIINLIFGALVAAVPTPVDPTAINSRANTTNILIPPGILDYNLTTPYPGLFNFTDHTLPAPIYLPFPPTTPDNSTSSAKRSRLTCTTHAHSPPTKNTITAASMLLKVKPHPAYLCVQERPDYGADKCMKHLEYQWMELFVCGRQWATLSCHSVVYAMWEIARSCAKKVNGEVRAEGMFQFEEAGAWVVVGQGRRGKD